MDPVKLLDISIALGVVMLILVQVLRGKLHGDNEFQREVERGDKWERAFFDMLEIGHQATDVADTAVKKVRR